MILHEVLKYESLELVVGLELDKGVNQATFLHFETLPHFDNKKVKWWFGDAARSLDLLPRSYLASFDLIFVDLQNWINKELKLMEAVSRYAHPLHGVIVRNEDSEDVGFGTNDPFALHSVDVYDEDVPVFCHQLFTMGSNVVDLMTASRTLHSMVTDPLYYNPAAEVEESNLFRRWYNYRREDKFAVKKRDALPEVPASAGILMVLELEQVSAEKMSADILSSALETAGMTLTETKTFGETVVFLAQEGYVVARAFPGDRYYAVDVMFWSNYEKMDSVEESLASSLGSGITSSYRIITGGIVLGGNAGWGEGVKEMMGSVFGTTQDAAGDKTEEGKDVPSCSEEKAEAVTVDPSFALPIDQPHSNAAMQSVLSSLLSNGSSPEILILCGEETQPCGALDVANSAKVPPSSSLTSINACPASESIFACESKFRSSIHNIMKSGNKIDAILIDTLVPKQSAQILHRIFGRSELRGQVLSDSLVVVGVTLDPSSSSSSWLRVLLDQFRKVYFPYDPSYHSEVIFYPPGRGDSNEGLGVSAYSAGNRNFYSNFVQVVGEIAETTGLTAKVKYVRNGLNNYIADFGPTHEFSRGDYDINAAKKQRASQKPLGRQSVVQFDAKAKAAEYTPNSIKSGLETVMSLMGVKKAAYELHDFKIGDGRVFFALWEGSDASVIYDGRSKLDLTLFTLDQDKKVHDKFEKYFIQSTPSVTIKSRDVQPRGAGRVVAFRESPWD